MTFQFIATPAPLPKSGQVPHLRWPIAGVSKIFGAGLRLAYVQAPDAAKLGAFAQAVRISQVMTNPLNLALRSTWMEDGTATALQAFVRGTAKERQDLASDILAGHDFKVPATHSASGCPCPAAPRGQKSLRAWRVTRLA